MRMMKKVLGTVTVLALSVSLLAGCGSTAASPVSSAASTAAESTTSSVVSETTSAAADENVACRCTVAERLDRQLSGAVAGNFGRRISADMAGRLYRPCGRGKCGSCL